MKKRPAEKIAGSAGIKDVNRVQTANFSTMIHVLQENEDRKLISNEQRSGAGNQVVTRHLKYSLRIALV